MISYDIRWDYLDILPTVPYTVPLFLTIPLTQVLLGKSAFGNARLLRREFQHGQGGFRGKGWKGANFGVGTSGKFGEDNRI